MARPESTYKTEQLILYICKRFALDSSFGSIKLNKALYYIDNIRYLKTGKPISIFTYVRQDQGPTPKPQQFLPVRQNLIANKCLEIKVVEKIIGRHQKVPVALTSPDLKVFEAEEISFIDNVLNAVVSSYNASEISDLSHNEISWQLANHLEELPYYTFLLSKAEVRESDLELAETRISEYEKNAA